MITDIAGRGLPPMTLGTFPQHFGVGILVELRETSAPTFFSELVHLLYSEFFLPGAVRAPCSAFDIGGSRIPLMPLVAFPQMLCRCVGVVVREASAPAFQRNLLQLFNRDWF
jgi:hypothetical protein